MKTDGGIALVDATGDFALMGDLGLAVGEEGTGDLDRERTPMSLLRGTGDLTRRRLTEDAADKADGLVGPALFTLLPEDAAVDTFNFLLRSRVVVPPRCDPSKLLRDEGRALVIDPTVPGLLLRSRPPATTGCHF